jgi:N-acetyl-anhydromuramyl-L-alanine amidase AmpD
MSKKLSAILVALLSTAYKNGGEKSQDFADLLEKLKSDDLKDEDLNETEITSLIKELDKARVKELRTKSDESGYKRAQAETLSKLEKDLREKYQVDQDEELQGESLIAAILEKNGKKTDKDLTEDAVKKHPAYVQAVDAHKKALETVAKEWQDKLDAHVKTQTVEKTFSTVSEKALSLLDSRKPVLSQDATKAANQKQLLIKELKAKGYQFEDQNGTLVVLDKDGKLLEDAHGHRVTFEAVVNEISDSLYDFQVSKEGRSAPHQDDKSGKTGTQAKKPYTGVMPKTEDEYIKQIADEKTPLAERLALKDAWHAQQQPATV